MKPLFLAMLAAVSLLAMSSGASTIYWGACNGLLDYDYSEGGIDYYTLHGPFLGLQGRYDGESLTVWPEPYLFMEFSNCFALASVGDEISAEFMDGQSEYFYRGEFDVDGSKLAQVDYDLIIHAGETVFLGFASHGNLMRPEDANYGWLELGMSDDHMLVIINSAMAANGESLFVGLLPVPEPCTLALVVIGIVVLGMSLARRMVDGTLCRLG